MKRVRERSTGYPWDKWFKRKRFRLKRGVHFDCAPHSMSVQIRLAAKKRNMKVSIFIYETELDVELK